jgi:hypothetical protein
VDHYSGRGGHCEKESARHCYADKRKKMKKLKRTLAIIPLMVLPHLRAASPEVIVYKTRTCGCCAKWVDHLKANGFAPTVNDVPSTAEYRRKYGVPDQLQSCHTATVGGYTVEGHVPASDIQQLLKKRPKATGLAVPGMPLGSPGMEGPRSDTYSVLLFHSDGRTSVFRRVQGN